MGPRVCPFHDSLGQATGIRRNPMHKVYASLTPCVVVDSLVLYFECLSAYRGQ